jgi:hypothetical protein
MVQNEMGVERTLTRVVMRPMRKGLEIVPCCCVSHHWDENWEAVKTYELLEEGGTEEEDEVDTGPLLHHLQRSTQDSTTEVAVGLPERSLEAVGPWREVAALRNNRQLVLVVGNDFSQLLSDILRIFRLSTDRSESLCSLLVLALLDKVTRRFWQEEDTNTEDQGPQELDSNRDTVWSTVHTVLGGVDNDRGEKDTDGDAELVASDESTTNLSGTDLRHVQDNNCRLETNTESSNETTSGHEGDSSRNDFHDDSDGEDQTAEHDGCATTEEVSKVTGDESTCYWLDWWLSVRNTSRKAYQRRFQQTK